MGEGAPSMSLGSSPRELKPVHRNSTPYLPATLNRYTANSPTHLVTSRNTVRTDLVNRTTQAEAERKRDGKTAEKAVELGFAGGAAYRVGNVGNRLERLGIFLHRGCDLFVGVHDRRVIATPESGSDLGK